MHQRFQMMMGFLAVPGLNSDNDNVAAARDTTPRVVLCTILAAGPTGVFFNRNITATFREAMDATTNILTTFTLTPTLGGPALTGVFAGSSGRRIL